MKNLYEAYHLLGDDASSQEDLELPFSQPKARRVCSVKGITRILPVVFFVTSLVLSGFLRVYVFELRKEVAINGATQSVNNLPSFMNAWLIRRQSVLPSTCQSHMSSIQHTMAKTRLSQMKNGGIFNLTSMLASLHSPMSTSRPTTFSMLNVSHDRMKWAYIS